MDARFVVDPKSTEVFADRPTPEEQAVLDDDGKIHPTRWLRRENWGKIAGILVFIVVVVLFDVFQTRIVHALEPDVKWLHDTRGAWVIPVVLCIVLCIPPLMGIEVVLIIMGLTWSWKIGFLMAGVSVFLGELFTFYIFKFALRKRAAKLEEKDVKYAILARAIRDGGIKMAIVARYSIIPAHVLTALMATCDVSLFTFVVSAIASLPRPWIGVFIGYNLQLVADGHAKPAVSAAVSNVSLALTVVTTLASGWYMRRKQRALRVEVVRERCERRATAHRVVLPGGLDSATALEDGTLLRYPPSEPLRAHMPSSDSLLLKEVPSVTGHYDRV